MSLFELLAHPGLRPFEIAFAIVLGLLGLELLLNLLGLSALGAQDSDVDIDLDAGDAGFDLSDVSPSMGKSAVLDMLDAGHLHPEVEPAQPELDATPGPSADGALSWLGLGHVPMTIWLAGLLTGFALSGYLMQLGVSQITGSALGAGLASALALPPALWFARASARVLGRLVPKTTTTAIARRSYHRRRGVITVGTARSGRPAQARFRDGHGNTHYTMVEPLDPAEELAQGTEILILRIKGGPPRALALSDITHPN